MKQGRLGVPWYGVVWHHVGTNLNHGLLWTSRNCLNPMRLRITAYALTLEALDGKRQCGLILRSWLHAYL